MNDYMANRPSRATKAILPAGETEAQIILREQKMRVKEIQRKAKVSYEIENGEGSAQVPTARPIQMRGYLLFGRDKKDFDLYHAGVSTRTLITRGGGPSLSRWPQPTEGVIYPRTAVVYLADEDPEYQEKAYAFEFIGKDYMLQLANDAKDDVGWHHWNSFVAGSGSAAGHSTRIQELRYDAVFLHETLNLIKRCIKNPTIDRFNDKEDGYWCPYHEKFACPSTDAYHSNYSGRFISGCRGGLIWFTCDNGLECYFVVGRVKSPGAKKQAGEKYIEISGPASFGTPNFNEQGVYMTVKASQCRSHMEICDNHKKQPFELLELLDHQS